MARIRTVKPKFWDDIKLSKVSRDARLLFVGMWNFADDCGVILGEPIWIKSKVFPYDTLSPKEFDNLLKELLDISVIIPGLFREEVFYYIKNFKRHQVINKPNNDDLYIPKDCISDTFDHSLNNPGIITEQSRNDTVWIRGGEERKGKERKGEERATTNYLNGMVVYNAEEEILKNQVEMERICIATGKSMELAKESLRKYHLHLADKEQYPKGKKSIFAGFEKWLLNEKIFNSNGNGKKTNGNVGKTIEFDKP